MPDPSVRYGGSYLQKERQKILSKDPTGLIQDLINGNKQSQAATDLPGILRGLAGAQKRSKQRASQPSNPGIDDIVALQNMLGIGMNPVDMDALRQELRKAIAGQYDPMISYTNKDIAGAKKRAVSAKKDIGTVYDDLVNYYEGQVAPTKERGKQSKAAADANANALKQSITDDYAARIREQVDDYKRLGIEAAVPSATDQQDADKANALAMAANTQASENAAIDTQNAADLAYWTEGAGIANNEGSEQQAIITQQLNQYLNEQNKQLALLKGQKSAAYHQGLMQLQQQAAEAASQQQNQLWDRMMQLARLKLSAASQASSTASKTPGRGLTGALAFLGDVGQGGLGGTFQQYISESQRWANTPQARAMYGGKVDTPEEWAQIMRDNAANKGLSPQQQQALFQAMLRYMGRG